MKSTKERKYDLMFRFVLPGKVVNLGSGKGEMAKYFEQKLLNVINVDMVEGDMKFDLSKRFPLKSNTYDTILAGEIIEHLGNPKHFLSESYRILKKNGRIILTTPNMIGLPYLLSDFIGKDRFPHIVGFNIEMIRYQLRKAGFKIIFARNIECFWKKNFLFRAFTMLFSRYKSNILIVGQK